MISTTIARDLGMFARESFTVLLLAALLLVTACSSTGYSQRAELAPPPPFSAMPSHEYGPPTPVEIAMIQSLDNIMPAAGEAQSESFVRPCTTRTSLSQEQGRLGFGMGDIAIQNEGEFSFARMHSGRDAAEMTMHFTIPLPTARVIGCR